MTEDEFLVWVRANTENANLLPDQLILDTAQMTCDTLDAGDTYQHVISTMTNMEISDEQLTGLAGVAGAALPAFCPEYMDETFGTAE